MYVSDFMSKTTTVKLDQESDIAFQLMEDMDLDFLPVIDGSETVVGVLSRLHAERAANRFRSMLAEISEIMDCRFCAVTSDTPLAKAAEQMVVDHTNVLAVTDDDGRHVGLLTSNDLHRALVDTLRDKRAESHHAA
ncbi:MAG: CBS domain-containing protein [Chromatiaceae bacterium]|jgi:CBS domain-containing protein